MLSILKRCLFLFTILLAANMTAVDNQKHLLPKFKGISAFSIENGSLVHPSHLLVRLDNEKKSSDFKLNIEDLNIIIKKKFNSLPGLVLVEVNHLGVDTNKTSEIKENLINKLNLLSNLDSVKYVEHDVIDEYIKKPNDSAYVSEDLWGLNNSGANGGIFDADIDAPEAWDITTGSDDVIVVVLDSGINVTHQDLEKQLWINEDEVPNNGRDDDGDGYVDNINGINPQSNDGDLTDNTGHGTHVAGTIGASPNDQGSHVGIAWNVSLLGVKGGDYGFLTSALLSGIEFAISEGATVVNCSFG